jgi:membrane protein CcdC involved in cytochrome C biogenesis
MVEARTISEVSNISIRFSAAFAIIGIGLLYLYIAISDVSSQIKVLWASGLSIAVAAVFLVIWTIARDVLRERERELKRKQ